MCLKRASEQIAEDSYAASLSCGMSFFQGASQGTPLYLPFQAGLTYASRTRSFLSRLPSVQRATSHQAVTIPVWDRMPTELVLEVAAHLSSRPLYCFMKTSRRMHNTLLPELYRELRFMDAEITHSLTCLWNVVRISPNETTACIAMVQSLSLISLRLAEEHIFLPVLQKLLLAMPNLRSLHLHIQMPTESARSEMGIISLTRCAQIFMVLRLTENGHPLVCPLLANISTFDLDTASDLMGSHGITALRIIDALRYADVVTLAYRIGRYSSRTLTALWIRLYEVADMEVAISALTRTLTNLRELSVGQEFILRGNIIEDKAFARSRAVLLRLREDANYLPSLRRLSLWGASTILVSSAERATIRSLLLDIGRVRPMFRYGAVYGVKVEGSQNSGWVVQEYPDPLIPQFLSSSYGNPCYGMEFPSLYILSD